MHECVRVTKASKNHIVKEFEREREREREERREKRESLREDY